MDRVALIFVLFAFSYVASNPLLDALKWNERIVGGSNAKNGDAPYMASLRSQDNISRHFCGGSVISSYWILTAAHCTVDRNHRDLLVVVGSVLNDPINEAYGTELIINHPRYDPVRIENDISLLKTLKGIALGINNIDRIPLHSVAVEGEKLAIMTGWGRMSHPNGPLPNNLQIIQLKTLSYEDCVAKSGPNAEFVTEKNICTFTKAGEGTCFGDSGGPLVVDGKQEGIASWVEPCAVGYPDAYTRVSAFREWILEVSGV